MLIACAGKDGATGPAGAKGAMGDKGSNGSTSLISIVAEPAGANCPDGGQKILTGLDDGSGGGSADDGVLQAGEVKATAYICNGPSGTSGTGSLVKVSPEAAGAHCMNGGQRIDGGLDNGDGGGTAHDGILQTGEIDTTSYVCNGNSGFDSLVNLATEAAGANCTYGGQRIESGLDNGDGGGTAGDGILQTGEIDATTYLCGPCGKATLSSVQSVSINYPAGGSYNDDSTRAYSNPTGACAGGNPPCDITGWWGFDLSTLPDSAVFTSMTLKAYMNTLYLDPSLVVQYSNSANWTRAAATYLNVPRTTNVSVVPITPNAGQVNTFVPFAINVGAQDWSADLAANWLTLGLDNVNTNYTFAYFAGSDTGSRATLDVTFCQ
ncbi:MAG: hypothetical protein QM723_37165 [Myxococcaceae bacterium]